MIFYKVLLTLFMLPVLLSAKHHHEEVGPLRIDGIVVTNLEDAITQWQSGTGNQFGSIQTNIYSVHIPGQDHQNVTLRSSFSNISGPFIELVEATPAIGPWAPEEGNGRAPGYLGFAVASVHDAGQTLKKAGLKLVASSDSDFAIYKGINGYLVKLIREDLVPTSGSTNTPQAPIVFGGIHHTDVGVYNFQEAQQQLGKALSLTWNYPGVAVTGTPQEFAGVGLVPTDVSFIFSNNIPLINVEYGNPHIGGFAASPTTGNFRPVYEVPTGTVAAHRDQLLAAGFVLNTLFEVSGTPLVAIFSAPQGYWIEVVDASVD